MEYELVEIVNSVYIPGSKQPLVQVRYATGEPEAKATDPKTEPVVQLSVERPESQPSAFAILHLPRSTPSTAIDQSFPRDLFPVQCFQRTTLPFPYTSNEPIKERRSEFGET